MSWTAERIQLLEKLWMDGRTASEIAKEMGGVTRNAVIGKAHRMGLSGRPSPIKKVATDIKTDKKTVAKTVKKAKEPALKIVATKQAEAKSAVKANVGQSVGQSAVAEKKTPAVQAKSNSVTANVFSLKEKMCKWPIGDPRSADFHFCGARACEGLPYCEEHAAMAYQSTGRRKPLNIEDLVSQA